MRNTFFSKLYEKAKKLEETNNFFIDVDDKEYVVYAKDKLKNCIAYKRKNMIDGDLVNNDLIIERKTIKKGELVFDIFILKIRDIKSFYDRNKYNYITSMILTYEESNNNMVKKWGIEDIKTTFSDNYNKALKDYQNLNELIINNELEHIFNEITKYLEKS